MKDRRSLKDLESVGPATLRDFELLGIRTVPQLARKSARGLYLQLCEVNGTRCDPCCQDVFSAAIAQARDPNLPQDQRRWWYWSRLRKLQQA